METADVVLFSAMGDAPEGHALRALYQFFEKPASVRRSPLSTCRRLGGISKIQTLIASNDLPDVIYIAIEGFKLFRRMN